MPSSLHYPKETLTVIVPAYNEGESIEDTVYSLKNQTVPPHAVIVVDDCSTDDTFSRAQAAGATVIRPPVNTGSKAGAQNFALAHVNSSLVMAIDADTTLAPDAIEKLLPAINPPGVAAACGSVIPRFVQTVWERGRYVEYLLAFVFYKPIQDYYGKPLIASGCFSVYRTEILREVGGWPTRTLAEDMDLTWTFFERGYQVRFMPEAVSFPIEPHDFSFMAKQLRRWSHGLAQNILLHWRSLARIPYLNSMLLVSVWDSLFASLAYVIITPIAAIALQEPLFFLIYVIDLPVLAVPILTQAARRGELAQAVVSLPSFVVVRLANSVFMLEAYWSEWFLRRTLSVYEKGH